MLKLKSLRLKGPQLTVSVAILCIIFIFLPPLSGTFFRIIFGLCFTLLLPGYTLIVALFHKENDINALEKFVLSICFSMIITPLIGLVLCYTHYGIGLVYVSLSLLALIIAFSLLAWYIEARSGRRYIRNSEVTLIKEVRCYFLEIIDTYEKIPKLLSIISMLAVIYILSMIKQNPVDGYELSIYRSLSTSFWLCLSLIYLINILVLIYYAFNTGTQFWKVNYLIIILTNFIFLSLGSLRGYFLYNHVDPIYHLGRVKDFLSVGYNSENIYPTLHLLIAIIARLTGLYPESIMRYWPSLNYTLYFLLLYILFKVVLENRRQVILAIAASTPFLYNNICIAVYPQAFATYFLPLFFYLYFRRKDNIPLTICFLILLIAYPFMHPATAVVVLFFIIAMELVKIVIFKEKYSIEIVLILLITLFTWVSSYYIFDISLHNLVSAFKGEYRGRWVEVTRNMFSGVDPLDRVMFILKMYFDSLVFYLITFISVVIIFLNKIKVKKEFFLLATATLVILLAQILIFATGKQNIGRFLNLSYLNVVSPIFVSFMLSRFSAKPNKLLPVFCITLFMSCITISSMFSVYHSPYILQPNWQVTYSEISGTIWFFSHNDNTIPISSMGYSCALPFGVLGYDEAAKREDVKSFSSRHYGGKTTIPDHFGYPSHSMLGETLKEETYLIITELFKKSTKDPVLHEKGLYTPPIFWRGFESEDLRKLSEDQSVNKIYTNGGMDIFYIKPVMNYE